ncbi:histidine phosphatase family protein [Candidatus Parcubacteria bacterium]|jgi:broad specificity phosphatase PhoE|nr:histidine phosphatase family protein [Candidatus Parcubacteria bacterium]
MDVRIKTPFVNVRLETPYAKTLPVINGPYTRIYLIRHCHPDYGVKHVVGDEKMPLSKLGLKQRKLLNKKLKQIQLEKIYASELLRAKETAADFAKKNKKRIHTDKRLNEIDWTEWYKIKYFNMSEKTRIRRVQKYKKIDKELHQLHSKSRKLLADIYKKNKGKRVGVFCHGNLIRAMVTSILHTDVIVFLSMEIYQSSVTKLVIDRDGYIKINYINNICHLPHKPDEDLFMAALNQ